MPSRRRLLAVGAAVLSAGCPALGTGDGSPSGDTPTPNGTGPTPNDPPEECQPSTPEPVPDLSVTNDAADAVTVTVTVRPATAVGGTATAATDGSATVATTTTATVTDAPATTGDPLYEQSHALEPGETVDVDDVLPEQGTYRVTVAVATGADGSADVTTESATVEGGPTRYGLVSVRIERPDAVDVGWLHVVPPATPTPCP